MPCYYTGSAEGDARLAAREAHEKLTSMTEIACQAMAALESLDELKLMSAEANEWWQEHKAIDALRKSREVRKREKAEAKKKALAKLSPDEKEVLGLD